MFPGIFPVVACNYQDCNNLCVSWNLYSDSFTDTREDSECKRRNSQIQGGRKMMIYTTEQIAGKRITETLGLVSGSTIRARHIGQDITAVLRNIVGGEIKEYTVMLAQAREEALQRMIDQAEKIEASAVVGVRLATSTVTSGAAEIVAYGTAVKVEKD
jgi:uncharacterized protein YbjQ (UPF0145 family)